MKVVQQVGQAGLSVVKGLAVLCSMFLYAAGAVGVLQAGQHVAPYVVGPMTLDQARSVMALVSLAVLFMATAGIMLVMRWLVDPLKR